MIYVFNLKKLEIKRHLQKPIVNLNGEKLNDST